MSRYFPPLISFSDKGEEGKHSINVVVLMKTCLLLFWVLWFAIDQTTRQPQK